MRRRNYKISLNIKLLVFNLIGMTVAAVLLISFSGSMFRSIYQQRYEAKLKIPANIFLAQYSDKDIRPYINALKQRNGLENDIKQYSKDRLFIKNAQKGRGESDSLTSDYYEATDRINAYIEKLSADKDNKYSEIKKRMLDIRVGSGLTDFFIFADVGLENEYVYIFNAIFQGDGIGSFNEDYGIPVKKEDLKEAEKVFKTGEAVAVLYDDKTSNQDKSCFILIPINDIYGETVAVIGENVNIQSLASQLQSFLLNSTLIIIAITFALITVLYIMIRTVVIKPVSTLTAISNDIVNGNIEGKVPSWLMKKNDEIGTLGRAYDSMGSAFRNMHGNNTTLLESIMSGQLNTRTDTEALSGFFSQAACGFNDTLDVIVNYFDNLPNALAILNSDYDIAFVNDQWRLIFSDIADLCIYRMLFEKTEDNVTEDSVDSIKIKLRERLETDEISTLVWVDTPEGKRCLSFRCSRVARNGDTNGAIIIVTDSTELVNAKDKAQSANKAKSEFLSRVSHELRTPLNVILSMAKFGVKDCVIDDARNRFRKIVTSSSHLSNIINDVLEMSRMESGKTEIRKEQMNPHRLAEECIELMNIRAEENSTKLLLNIDPKIPSTVIGDEFRIRQIIINLLSNSIKFTEKGCVSLILKAVERDGNHCRIMFAVNDTGIGMSEEFLSRIFNPFEQEDSFLSRRYAGSGLGLSISSNLVSLMGGEMTVKSKLGKGSRLEFTLPFEITDSAVSDETDETLNEFEGQLSGKRILLADDVDINRTIIQEVFTDTGVIFDEAADGQQAIDMFTASPCGYYDCVFMDIQMPKMDGYSATQAIRSSEREDADVPIIAMTANALKEDVMRSEEAGMTDHIAKPIDFAVCLKKAIKWTNERHSKRTLDN